MANYTCAIRTNYFKVKDNEKFEEFMSHIYGEDFYVFDMADKDGNTLYAFGCYGNIGGYFDSEEDCEDGDWDNAYDAFVNGLVKQVAEDDAVLIFESGNEKLRYVIGNVTVITSKGYEYRDITDIGVEMAREMLNNPDYSTQCDY